MINRVDVTNAEKALQKICENNKGFEFEKDDYKNLLSAAKYHGGSNSGKGGIGFTYSYNGSHIGIQISDELNEIIIGYELSEDKTAEWFYIEFQRLFKIANETFSNLKINKTK